MTRNRFRRISRRVLDEVRLEERNSGAFDRTRGEIIWRAPARKGGVTYLADEKRRFISV